MNWDAVVRFRDQHNSLDLVEVIVLKSMIAIFSAVIAVSIGFMIIAAVGIDLWIRIRMWGDRLRARLRAG
ncbi:hypothetical protein A3A70_01600 [candidate division WWE3 bacterium RIFCSPLOWO2_01_FULL_42_11]|uniref:Uncharacterized protein n=1 Tax=candidate division WWE3 bacterium RIFCSPLOWO2_01_FULL_42_11 TaxID=1802627 RepID=A0A1F4VR73_UNCKA|nr:MAG: hypothetical protein A3A70_01600 [candidate division WWE3 bacterium RIFCSPLOWO2_01_FULL_42_11]